jgi:hypothetical protein
LDEDSCTGEHQFCQTRIFTTCPASHTLKGSLLGIWTKFSATMFCVSCTNYPSARCTAAEN